MRILRHRIECLTEEMFTSRGTSMPDPKANILVAFYSRDGSVEALAKSVSEGAREAGAEVRSAECPILSLP